LQAVSPALPILDTGIASVSSFPDTENVQGRASASLSASFPPRTTGLFRVRQGVSLGGRDAAPGGFFTTLDATATSTSTIVIDTSLSLASDQSVEMTALLLVTHDGVAASIFSGTYEIVDLDTGDTPASLAVGSANSVTLDVSALVGHRLQASFTGESGVSLPAGFGDGAGPLAERDFFHNVEGQVALRIVPEPATIVLLGIGMAALGAHRR